MLNRFIAMLEYIVEDRFDVYADRTLTTRRSAVKRENSFFFDRTMDCKQSDSSRLARQP